MDKLCRVALIIPCCNEQDTILSLLTEIKHTAFHERFIIEPIVVNDCSTDNTRHILISNNINFIDLPVNLGIGGAVQAGFKYALRYNFDIAVQMDGDGQHPPKDLEKLLFSLYNDETDVAIGSRYITKLGFQSTVLRRLGINYFRWLNKRLTGITLYDSTSGYRALNKRALEIVSDYYPDEYPEPESVVLFSSNHIRMKEIPIEMRERQGGKSSIRAHKTVYYMLKVTLGIIFLYIRLKFDGKRHTI